MPMELPWLIVLIVFVISLVVLIFVTRRAIQARKRGKPVNLNLYIALVTFVMVLFILLFTQFYRP
jgi:heme/copper-type cytochrome/quinol oxidase subunit 2